MTRHQTVVAVTGMLYLLPEAWRGVGNSDSFDRMLRQAHHPSLHAAFKRMHDEGLLEGVYENFEFDPLYGMSNIGTILAEAWCDMLVKIGGHPIRYHIDELQPEEVRRILKGARVDEGTVRCAAQRLLEILEEQVAEANSLARAG